MRRWAGRRLQAASLSVTPEPARYRCRAARSPLCNDPHASIPWPSPAHISLSDLRGFQQLASDATVGLTDLVEAMHHTIARGSGVVGRPSEGRTRGITGPVYRSVRGIPRIAGGGLDALLAVLAPRVAEKPSSPEREAVLAALNGVLGDYLAASANPLSIGMCLRVAGLPSKSRRPH